MKVLVTEPLSEGGLAILRSEFQVDVRPDLAASGLREEIARYGALVVRSQTKVTAEVIDRADALKVVARAGIGLDNVDVDAATRRGVLVVNAPQSNIVSAAEHTFGLLLSQARNIPQAHAALKAGVWERGRFQGVELHGKTLGILGLGRVGTMVAARARSFGMRIVAFDPYISPERAREGAVELVPQLDALLMQCDFLSVHLPLTSETTGLVGERELGLLKQGARVLNTARGGVIDEQALAKALRDRRIAGAALDVFADEPVTSHPLFELDSVVVTPHLGAATREAQDRAGATIAEMVVLALRGEFVPYAVNLSAPPEVDPQVRAFMPLGEKLGAVLTGLVQGRMGGIETEYAGRLAEHDTRLLTLSVLKGALSTFVDEPVSLVNAPVIADERGLAVVERKTSVSLDYVNLVTVRSKTDGGEVSVSGTLFGKRGGERLVGIYGFDIDIAPTRHMAFFLYEDRPGVIGTVGSLLGAAGINIAGAEVGRREAGGLALMGLALDSAIPAALLAEIERAMGAERAMAIVLPVREGDAVA